MKFDVLNRWYGEVQFTADIDCDETEISSIKLGLAVKWGVKNNANLRNADLWNAKNIRLYIPISFVGNEIRTGYAYWDDEVRVILGCFEGTEKEALEAVGNKYGKRSSYCQMIRAACRIARERKIINPTEEKDAA